MKIGEQNAGEVNISDEVVSIIASHAAKDIPGISSMQNSLGTGIAEFLGKKNLSKGVKVNVNDSEVVIDLFVIIEYDVQIPQVAWKVQERVKSKVEEATGLNVISVNVHVEGINIKKDDQEENVKDYIIIEEEKNSENHVED
ncbi:MAG: Asp23/Gls24 family envelope stress response protein [Clostridiales bacterium]|jgi:uncharacterized alkaline shock family protein YloU|nr:Asp23/Gls24 family envelope stress response protein [Clostridiales bacterium]